MEPRRLRQLTWDELDCVLEGQAARRQRDMEGPRLIAVQVHNALAKTPLEPADYLHLPAVDGPRRPAAAVDPAWKERMKAKFGNLLEA